jgi:hypothetical protein
MTEPSSARPSPGPPRPGPGVPHPASTPADGAEFHAAPTAGRFADLGQRPVAEHVAVFEEEHSRLQRELGTIDQL